MYQIGCPVNTKQFFQCYWYVRRHGCMCGVPVLSVTYQICCCDCRLYLLHSNNTNEYMLIMMHVPLLIVLLVVCQYMSVLYIVLPKNGLTSILTLRALELDLFKVPMYQCQTAVSFFQFVAQATQDLSLWNLSLVWFYQPALHCI